MNVVRAAALMGIALSVAWGNAAEKASAQSEAQSVGAVTFVVNGEKKSFDHLPGAENTYTVLATTIRAAPAPAAREKLSITFMSIDLKKQQYPADLPPPRGRGPGANPLAAMANVGFSYIDSSGQEWAGPGRVHIESFGRDGVIAGSFSTLTLPHTDRSRSETTLTDGTFRARISAPW